MPINAMIPLMTQQPQLPTPVDLLQAQRLQGQVQYQGLQNQYAQQELENRNAMMALARQPGMRDAGGIPTSDYIRQMSYYDPAGAVKMTHDVASIGHQRSLTQSAEALAMERYEKQRRAANYRSFGAYQAALTKGDQAAALAEGQRVQDEEYPRLKAIVPNLPPPRPFDPVRVEYDIKSAPEYVKEQMGEEREARRDVRTQYIQGQIGERQTAALTAAMERQNRQSAAAMERIAARGDERLSPVAQLRRDRDLGRISDEEYQAARRNALELDFANQYRAKYPVGPPPGAASYEEQFDAYAARRQGKEAPPLPVLELPEEETDLKKDRVYNTSHGRAKWTGSGFQLVK